MTSRNPRTKKVLLGSFWVMGSSVIGNLTRLALVVILSRYYSKEEFGVWATISSTAAVIAYGDFGIINALRNKLSSLITRGEEGMIEARDYFFSALIFFSVCSILISLLVYLLSNVFSFDVLFKTNDLGLQHQGVQILLWVQFFFFINIPLSMGFVSFFSFHESQYSAFFTAVQALISFFVALVLIILKYSIFAISVGYFLSGTVMSAVGTIYFLKKRHWFSFTFRADAFLARIKELLSTGVKFMGLQLSGSFLQNAATVLASSFLGLSIAAEYNMVQKLYAFLMGIYQGILNPVWAGYAEASAKSDWQWSKKTLNFTLILSSIGFTISIIIFYLFGNQFLQVLAGKNYITSPSMFLILGLTYLFIILFSTSTVLQNAINKIDFLLASLVTASIAIYPVSRIFMKHWGITGLAISTSLIWMVLFIVLTIQSYNIVRNFQKAIACEGSR